LVTLVNVTWLVWAGCRKATRRMRWSREVMIDYTVAATSAGRSIPSTGRPLE
jgi:hypothetical protein